MPRISVVCSILAALACAGAWGDSLFSSQVAARGTFISENLTRFQVGDLVTVLVQESIDAQTDSDLETEKESSVSAKAAAADNEFLVGDGGLDLFKPGLLPNWKIGIENESEAEGTTLRRNRLTATISCVVVKVFPNGNLLIEGQKRITVNREDTLLTISGIIRTRDVNAQNVVTSSQMANASIELKGQGPLWNNQRRGLFTKMLDWFSPF